MAKDEIETEGKTVTIAVEKGLSELGLRRDEVEVQVVDEGSAGFLGIGSKLARVRIRKKHWGAQDDPSKTEEPPSAKKIEADGNTREKQSSKSESARKKKEEARPSRAASQPRQSRSAEAPVDAGKAKQAAEEFLQKFLSLAEVSDPSLSVQWDEDQHRIHAEIESPDAKLLIGKGGRTLEALQFLATVIVGRKTETPTAVQVETQGYWKRIEKKILDEADRAAEEVKRTGNQYRFDPMEPSLRRLLHRKFGDHPDVETASEGEGVFRKIVLKPRKR